MRTCVCRASTRTCTLYPLVVETGPCGICSLLSALCSIPSSASSSPSSSFLLFFFPQVDRPIRQLRTLRTTLRKPSVPRPGTLPEPDRQGAGGDCACSTGMGEQPCRIEIRRRCGEDLPWRRQCRWTPGGGGGANDERELAGGYAAVPGALLLGVLLERGRVCLLHILTSVSSFGMVLSSRPPLILLLLPFSFLSLSLFSFSFPPPLSLSFSFSFLFLVAQSDVQVLDPFDLYRCQVRIPSCLAREEGMLEYFFRRVVSNDADISSPVSLLKKKTMTTLPPTLVLHGSYDSVRNERKKKKEIYVYTPGHRYINTDVAHSSFTPSRWCRSKPVESL